MFKKVISLFLSISLIITQPIFAQGVAQLNLAQYLGQARPAAIDIFRPTQLRYFSYDDINNSFRILLDKGDAKDIKDNQLKEQAKELMDYFLIGLTLPNDAFWVNLRPDSPDNIIDPALEKTDLGRILLEADLQLKKDTAGLTSPQTPEGKAYWDKLYKKAGELFGTENITIPTITRPWIVPGEIIVRESGNSAYIYKATLKVLLEQDYLKDSAVYNFSDPRLKELNEYSSQIIREIIIPKLTQEVNSGKRYAKLRQVYYSLVLSRWFKQKFGTRAPEHQSPSADYISLIDSGNLTNLIAKEPYDKLTYFKQYQESFAKGEYNLKEPVYTPYGQSIRSYMSGGFDWRKITEAISGANTKVAGSSLEQQLLNKENAVVLDNNSKIVKLEQPNAIAASPLITLKEKINEVFEAIEKKINDQGLRNYQEELAVFLKNLKKDLEGPAGEIDNIVNAQGTLKDAVKAIERVSTILFNRENEIDSIHMDVKSMMINLRRYELPSLMREIEKSLGQRETNASLVVLKYEVETIQVVREKLNAYHSGGINDFSKVSLSDLIASLNGTAKKIEEVKGPGSYKEQKEWIDIAKELLKVKAEVEKNIEMYREELSVFYARIGQNLGEYQKLYYDKYAQTIKATNDPDEIIASAEQAYKLAHGAASPIEEIKIEAKEAIENAGESLREHMLSDEAQNKYNISAEYIDQLETIKLWLWLDGAVKFFSDGLFNPEVAADAGRIVLSYKQLVEELKQHTTATQKLIKEIYATFKARPIKSADDAEALLKALLAMRREEGISKEELDISIEILSPRQADRVIPGWKIIETLKQFSAGEMQNRGISDMQKAILNILIDDNYPGCAFLRKERLEHFLRYAKTLVEKNYLDAEAVSLIETAIKEKMYGRALNIVMNLSKEKMGQALPEEVAEFNKKQCNVDIDNSIPMLSGIVEAYLNNKDSLLSKEEKAIAGNMYATSSAASSVKLDVAFLNGFYEIISPIYLKYNKDEKIHEVWEKIDKEFSKMMREANGESFKSLLSDTKELLKPLAANYQIVQEAIAGLDKLSKNLEAEYKPGESVRPWFQKSNGSVASPVELSSLKRAVNLFTLRLMDIASKKGNVKDYPDDVAKIWDDLKKLAEDMRQALDNFREGDSSLDFLDKLEAARKRLSDGVEIFISDLSDSAYQKFYEKGEISDQYEDLLKQFKDIKISKYQKILEVIVDSFGNDYDLAAESIRYVRESLGDYKVEIASGEYAQSQLSGKEFLASPVTLDEMKSVILKQAEILKGIVSKKEKLGVENMMGNFKEIKTEKELKRFLSNVMTAYIDRCIKERNDESVEELRLRNFKSHNEIYREIMSLISVNEVLGLIIKGSRYSASPVTVDEKFIDKFIDIVSPIYVSDDTNTEEISKAMKEISKEYRKMLRNRDVESFRSLLSYAQELLKHFLSHPFVEGGMDWDAIISKAVENLKELSYSLEAKYKPDENTRQGTQKPKGSAASPLFFTDNEKEELNNIINRVRAFNREYISWVREKHPDQTVEEIKRYMNTVTNNITNDIELEISKIKSFIEEGKLKDEKFVIKEWESLESQIRKIKNSIKNKMQNEFQNISVADKTEVEEFNKFMEKDWLLKAAKYVGFVILSNDDPDAGKWRRLAKDIIDYRLGSSQQTSASSITSELEISAFPRNPLGGIDFTSRAMKIGIERMGSFADLKLVLPEVRNAAAIDLDNEFKQIQLMASSGIRPSDTRILEFEAACYYRGEFGARLGEITTCLQQAHFLDERLGRESSEALRLATMLPEVM